MTVQEHINNDMKIAMREKRVEMRDLLRVVIGEFNRVGKEVSDEKAIAIIKKMAQNAKDQENTSEHTILKLYLPSQMDEAELEKIIQNCITFNSYSTMKDMCKVMGYLKKNYDGTYDGKTASVLVKKLLS